MKKYFTIWKMLTSLTTQIAFQSRFGAITFLIGKLLRFLFFLLFLFLLVSKAQAIAGYTMWEIIFFYATFNVIDTLSQLFLREVYRFRMYVVNGYFDYILTKPFSPLFRSLLGGADILDSLILLVALVLLVYAGIHLASVTLGGIVLYLFFIVNAFLIALAFHVFVLGIGILTTEVDNTIMLYRDITQMGRFPVDIYIEPLRSLITFVIPVGIMMTYPAKALMGLLSIHAILLSFMLGIFVFFLSVKFWSHSLKSYTSVSN